MDVFEYNRESWDGKVESGNEWTRPVDASVIEAARRGDWSLVLTPTKPVPRDWFPASLEGCRVLCLASGGGQQGPVLAAAGARVTVFDASEKQLRQDAFVAERDGLDIALEQGDMRDLSRFDDGAFDLIVHPVSNLFVESVLPVWREAGRVLVPGGRLLSGVCNPVLFLFGLDAWEEGRLEVRYRIPFSDERDLTPEEFKTHVLDAGEPVSHGHTLHDLIQGQIDAGFVLAGFYEDRLDQGPLDEHIESFIATLAVKRD